ncbi:MAG: helix-turn-helix domain-containing protein [Gammaproteobacteria bacterium]
MTAQRVGAAETRPLDILGISEAEEQTYRWLLAHPRTTVPEIAPALALTPGKAQRLLDSIEAKGLATHSPEKPQRYIPTAPDIALRALVLHRQEELQRTEDVIHELQEEAATYRHGEQEQMVELIAGYTAARHILEQIQRTAQHEIMVLTRPPLLISRLEGTWEQEQSCEIEAQARGVHFQSIVDHDFLSLPGAVDKICQAVKHGEEVRVLPVVPSKIVICDRRIAIIPLNPKGKECLALLVRSSGLLDTFCALFDILWEQAAPISLTREGLIKTGAPPVLLSHEGEKLMSLLAAGLNDKRLAQEMSISTATLTRRMSEIMKTFHARSRFQLGWLAHTRLSRDLSDKP